MTTVGPSYPGTVTTAAVSTENANDWLTPSNIGADDGSEAQITAATYDSPDISFRLIASNFGFTIPASATIDGIKVEIDRRSIIVNSGKDFRVQLQDASAALVGTNKAATGTIWPTTSAVATYGGATDTWSASPTPAMVNDPDFGVVLSVQANIANADIGVDYIRVTVDYTFTPTVYERAVVVAATGSIATVGQAIGVDERSASLASTAAIATSGEFFSILERSAALGVTASIATAGQSETPAASHERSAGLAATGSIAAAGYTESQAAAGLAATAAITVVGQRDILRASGLQATSQIATSGHRVIERSASLAATATVQTDSERDLQRQASLSAIATITAVYSPGGVHSRSASLSASGLIATAGDVSAVWERSVLVAALASIATSGITGDVGEPVLGPTRARILNPSNGLQVAGGNRVVIGLHQSSVVVNDGDNSVEV